MGLMEYVLTVEQKELVQKEAEASMRERNRLFSLVEKDISLLTDAFHLAEVPAHDLTELYKPAFFSKNPPSGWAISQRGDELAFLTSKGNPLMVRISHGKMRGYRESSFAEMARMVLPKETAIDNDAGSVKMHPLGDNGVKLAFSSRSVSEELARLVNNYNPTIHRGFSVKIN